MSKPVAAGKSSLDHVDQELAFSHIISDKPAVYLDLASGAGRYSLALAERVGAGSEIIALDLWEDGITALQESAAAKGLPITARVADITRPLPLEDESVDVCFIATVLHDLPVKARGNVIEEVRRVLKPGGTLVVIEFKKLDHGPGPRKELRIGEDDADALVTPHGFAKEVAVSLGEFPYLVKYRKA